MLLPAGTRRCDRGRVPLVHRRSDPARRRHQLALLLPLATPVVDGLGRDPRVPGDLSHALAVRWAHPEPDGFPQSGIIGRLHGRRLGPLVEGSDRADFFADSGGTFLAQCGSNAGPRIRERLEKADQGEIGCSKRSFGHGKDAIPPSSTHAASTG